MATSSAKMQRVQAVRADAGMFASAGKRNVVVCLLLVVATLTLYDAVSRNPFINCDDDRYITENPYIRGGLNWATVKWALSSTGQGGFWHPLTWISHALDVQLFGFNPAGHHFVSLLIHSCNAVLVFLLLTWVSGRWLPSVLVAALFAVHPLNVESVAWAAERKNVLSGFFFLACIGAYGWYAVRPNWKRYATVAGLFACALASKPMAVTLPFALLLLDYWPLGRMKRSHESSQMQAQPAPVGTLVVEKVPLLIMSAAASWVTLVAQKAAGATRSTQQFPWMVRAGNAAVSYAEYIWKILWPSRLTPVYPHPGNSLSGWQVGCATVLLLAVTGLSIFCRRRYLIVGWLWFLGILLPTIGLVQVGDQAMADRFAYIPELGIFVMIGFGLTEILDDKKIAPIWRWIPSAAAILALALVTHHQIGYWRSSYELWSHAVSITRGNFIAEDNLGGALILMGKEEEAHPHFEAAARMNPKDPMSRSNLGAYYQTHGQLREAIKQYETAVSLTSDRGLLAQTYANLGLAQQALGDDNEARKSFDQSMRLNPQMFNSWLGLGLLARKQGKLQEAIDDLTQSINLRPTAEACFELGQAYAQFGVPGLARGAYQQALKIDPGFTRAQQAADALPPTKP